VLPPEERLVGAQLHRYISDQLYWVLHAPRQTGKTTFLQSWMREINAGTEAIACYVSLGICGGQDVERSMLAICNAIRNAAKYSGLSIPVQKDDASFHILSSILTNWAELVNPKPLIVLFDDVDCLVDEILLSFLLQLRSRYPDRGVGKFPISVAMAGMRDIKEYIISSKDGTVLNPASPFNVKGDSTTLPNYTKDNVSKLFAQRTEETGQLITQEALDYVYEQSKGQPWIVNSFFDRATQRVLPADSMETVTLKHILQAREQMIEARETHFDALAERLHDPEMIQLIEPIITGIVSPPSKFVTLDLARDLGLISWDRKKGLKIANPMYEEILTRYLNSAYHDSMPSPSSWQWQKPDGSLDMNRMLKEFQKFWRRHSEIWEQRADYTEVFPHLLLMAFLQRVINGGGNIDREYAAGRGRMDLMVEYNKQYYIVEVKLIHYYDTPAVVREEGLEQIRTYRDKIDASAPAYLIIFDRRPETKLKPWEERIQWEEDGDVTVLEN